MKILIDMNLSPLWVDILKKEGWETIHWSAVGEHGSPDSEIMEWAKKNNYTVFTHDLDFSAILASTKADSPSVFQIRTQDVMPETIGDLVINGFMKFEKELNQGALVTINYQKEKAIILPLK